MRVNDFASRLLSANAYKSIKTPILIVMIGVLFFAVIVFGIFQYYKDTQAGIEEYDRLSNVALRPVIDIATRGIEGGDVIMLRSEHATSLYKISDVKYLKFSGMSRASEKTDFSDALPPKLIEHEFVRDPAEAAAMKAAVAENKDTHLDTSKWVYVVHIPLKDVKNGAELTAVFPADRLKGFTGRVVFEIGKVGFIVIALSILPLFFMLQKLIEPLNAMGREISVIGKDFTRRLPDLGQNEIGILCTTFNLFMDDLQQIVVKTADTSRELATASKELSASAKIITSGAKMQDEKSGKLESAAEEMSTSIANVARDTSKAFDTVKLTNDVVLNGNVALEKTISNMNDITSSTRRTSEAMTALEKRSHEIGVIVQVIKDIAAQTNLLALNAAIEAARAGEQGRGFAVVADEVRKLASRTATSTTEISEKIEGIQKDAELAIMAVAEEVAAVEEGTKLTSETGLVLSELVKSMSEVSAITQGIAVMTENQSSSSAEVSREITAIAGIAKETLENAHAVSDASHKMDELASQLQELVRQFKLS